jgi:hypothetical protein
MPRQPIAKVLPKHQIKTVIMGSQAIGHRPELETVICACMMTWPSIEAEMALALGAILRVENAPALALFQALRRSRAQREAISEAAAVVLHETDMELLKAILNVHKAIETERNALAHGHFGICPQLPDGILWQASTDYVDLQVNMNVAKKKYDESRYKRLIIVLDSLSESQRTQGFDG